MIQTEYFETREDGIKLFRTYSDANLIIEQVGTGARYTEAIDPENSGRTYIETDEPIEPPEPEEPESKSVIINV